jgi:hypothetical protein
VVTSLSCRNRILACLGAALACQAPQVGAADRQVNPRVELGYTLDDNYRLDLPGGEIDVAGALLQAQLEFRRLGPRSEFTLTPRLRATYFPDETQEDSNDYFLGLEHLYTTQRSRTRLPLRFADETVVLSELPGNDFNDPDGGADPGLGETGGSDAGRLSVRNRRQLIEFRPGFEHAFSPRQGLELQGRYTNVGFEQDVPGEQIGYREVEASAGWEVRRSERTAFTARVLANSFSPDTGVNEATGYGVHVEWSKQMSEVSSAYVRAGAQNTRIDILSGGVEETRDTVDYLAGVGGQRRGERFDFFVDLTRGVGPTSAGIIVARDQLRLRFTRRFTERMGMFAVLRGIRDESVDDATAYARRLYGNGNVGLEWRIRRAVSLAVTYDYTWQEFEDEADARASSGLLLSLIYEPNRDK